MNKTSCLSLPFLVLALIAFAASLPRPCAASSGGPGLRYAVAKEAAGTDWSHRKNMMIQHGIFVDRSKEIPLRAFVGGDDRTSRAVEGKVELVIHLLRRTAGDEAFSRVAKALADLPPSELTGWDDLRRLFEKESGQELGWFFEQWVDRKGMPDLQAENASVRRDGDAFEVSFDLVQKGAVYTLDLPVKVAFTRGGERAATVKTAVEKKHVTLLVDNEPASLVIDGGYDVPRRLTNGEVPPMLVEAERADDSLLVLPAGDEGPYAGLVEEWKRRGRGERQAGGLSADDTKLPLIVLGKDNPIVGRLYGRAGEGPGVLNLTAKKNPWNAAAVVVIVDAESAAAARDALHLLEERGECSFLAFFPDGRTEQRTDDAGRGIEMELRDRPVVVDISTLRGLDQAIEQAAEKRIVYVGEFHDQFAHHLTELQVIRSLFERNEQMAIGMEMFQRPFQQAVDDYINSVTDERTFLKKSEYFKRWGYDYNLYKPILDFARSRKIPVVALNLRREITEKVSREGIDALSEEEKKEIPDETDFSDNDYRDRLKQAFAEHKGSNKRDFDFFYQAQILWDETMAQSVTEYLDRNPGRHMVVIAGAGHLVYGSGIPKRAFRRNGLPFMTILNDEDVDRDIGDYVVFPEPLDGVTAPKLMVMLKEEKGTVTVTGLPDNSVSRKAGIEMGDRIVSVGGVPVESVSDIRIELFYTKPGDTIEVTVLRSYFLRFLFGEKKIRIKVVLE